jgi:hypothetical protein
MSDLRRLAAAPEIFIIDITDQTLDTLVRAFLVEHPALAENTSESDVGLRARKVIHAAHQLRRALEAYRRTVDHKLDQLERDLPF